METPLDIPCQCDDSCDCHVVGLIGLVYLGLIVICALIGLGMAAYQRVYG